MSEAVRNRRSCLALLAALALAACATVQHDPAGYSAQQTAALQTEGFERVGDNYQLGFPNRVLFAFDSSDVRSDTGAMLGDLAGALTMVGIRGATVEGHTDSRGEADYNIALSLRRADSVRAVLVAAGMDPARMRSVGIGEADPIESNDTEEGRSENRRVVIVVTPEDAMPL